MAVEAAAASQGMSAGSGAMGSGLITAVGSYLSAREQRKVEERQQAINMALAQRQNELNAIQDQERNMNSAYQNIMGAASQSLKYS